MEGPVVVGYGEINQSFFIYGTLCPEDNGSSLLKGFPGCGGYSLFDGNRVNRVFLKAGFGDKNHRLTAGWLKLPPWWGYFNGFFKIVAVNRFGT